MNWLSGFKTILTGAVVALGPAALNYFTSIDPVKAFGLSPTAGAVVGAVMIGLRAVTTSPIFQKS